MRLKKIPYYLALFLLTSGASLILGFLSFGGMFALWPVIPLAFGAFVLSVAYEGEIYLQNIKGALNKLFKHNYQHNQLAKAYLLEHFPDTEAENCPLFFKDYQAQLDRLAYFGHVRLDKESRARKKLIEKTLGDMEKWFAQQLLSPSTRPTSYERQLQLWLADNDQAEWQVHLANRLSAYKKVKAFSILAGIFMGLGTTYLLVEAFSIIPFFAAFALTTWPYFIVPMAIIAGTAYGLLTYNAVTDMITNDTLRTWYGKIRDKGLTPGNIFIATTAIVLVLLAFALTVCTAGTWWTVAKETRPLFAWMGRMPGFIMGIINPIITGLSAIVFNLQNTSESLELIQQATQAEESVFTRTTNWITKSYTSLRDQENWLQIINPFRLLLKLTIMPLRIVLFLGHLISIGVTADRVPGVSQRASALLGIISEGFEDAHYFISHDHDHEPDAVETLFGLIHEDNEIPHPDHDDHAHDHAHAHAHAHAHGHGHGHDHAHPQTEHDPRAVLRQERLSPGHGHNHDLDLPTRILKLIFVPIYLLAAAWDTLASKRNDSPQRRLLTFSQAWDKQMGLKDTHPPIHIPVDAPPLSAHWEVEQADYCIQRHKEEHLQGAWLGQALAADKIARLSRLQSQLRQNAPDVALQAPDRTVTRQLSAENSPVYGTHRFFDNGRTSTEEFMQELPARINGPS